MNEPLLTVHDVAKRLSVSPGFVRDHARRGYLRLPMIRVGGLLRCHPADLEAWIANLRATGIRKSC